jgi:hypothetical protein
MFRMPFCIHHQEDIQLQLPNSTWPNLAVAKFDHVEVGSCPICGHYLTDFTYYVTETHDLYQWL